jgi:uncharacterized cupin superfamily protein
MLEEKGGWFVVNTKNAQWSAHRDFGKRCHYQMEGPFPQVGINLFLLEPGKPNCRYHRESAQEDFLVLSGRCKLLANGEERELGPWDLFHCPPGVTHVLIGAGDGPCAVLAIGDRQADGHELYYPKSDLAKQYGAETQEPTSDPKVAYADLERPTPTSSPDLSDLLKSS